jgi:hypothetical protein
MRSSRLEQTPCRFQTGHSMRPCEGVFGNRSVCADGLVKYMSRTYPFALRHQLPAAPMGVTTPEPVQLYCVESMDMVAEKDEIDDED